MNRKVTGIVAYLGWIGWIIAYLAGDKEGGNFHLNQALVLHLGTVVVGAFNIVPVIGWLAAAVGGLFLLVCWIIGLVAAIQEEEKEVPLLGGIRLLK